MNDTDSEQAGVAGAADREPPLTAMDRAIIGDWRAMGIAIPAPELSPKALDDLKRELREVFQRRDDMFAGEW